MYNLGVRVIYSQSCRIIATSQFHDIPSPQKETMSVSGHSTLPSPTPPAITNLFSENL